MYDCTGSLGFVQDGRLRIDSCFNRLLSGEHYGNIFFALLFQIALLGFLSCVLSKLFSSILRSATAMSFLFFSFLIVPLHNS